MSWSDGRRKERQGWASSGLAGAVFAIVASVLVASCTVSPVYGPTATGAPLTAELAAIDIEPVGDRISQEVRNNLVFAFTGGGPAAPPRYHLDLTITASDTSLGITRVGIPQSRSVNITVSYNLVEFGTDRIVARGTARGIASYDETNQAFANSRARIDAENRAAKSAAEDVRLQIAAALAGRF